MLNKWMAGWILRYLTNHTIWTRTVLQTLAGWNSICYHQQITDITGKTIIFQCSMNLCMKLYWHGYTIYSYLHHVKFTKITLKYVSSDYYRGYEGKKIECEWNSTEFHEIWKVPETFWKLNLDQHEWKRCNIVMRFLLFSWKSHGKIAKQIFTVW